MKPCAYYNEFDPYAAQWLRNLIAAGHIAPGEVDERSITEVQPDDLRGFTQCHFFAGIGGWSYALRLAGWPDDRPVWTGSCPCQPFSAAGKQRGSDDERHLWPAFFDLIRECRPGAVFGEQVAGAAGYAWWDHVAADLEGEGYAAAAADLGAHSVGAPHLRQRLYWVAHSTQVGRGQERPHGRGIGARDGAQGWAAGLDAGGNAGRLADATVCGWPGQRRGGEAGVAERGGLGHAPVAGPQGRDEPGQRVDAQHAAVERAGAAGAGLLADADGRVRRAGQQAERGVCGWKGGTEPARVLTPWSDLEWLQCSDGKARPTQPGLFPLVDGVRDGRVALGSAIKQPLTPEQAAYCFNRVGTLRGAGNAIVPHLAAAFVRAAA